MRPVRSDSQCLSMLHAGKVVQQLVVLALARIHRVDALQHEARLVELGRGRLARLRTRVSWVAAAFAVANASS